ncbi:hypothetical protein [Aliivibrio sifiae]|uniref:D-fructose-6-phosphate amidotransferase n=1 Tax=Aliivibrio sifiae TaxID=566293 RepID=A0A2S7X5W8_9GAMM|nr:hypothetical protein [Aliivibrio sifiae]PQJ86771.1 D-fructose-6-phosphate amidotransferase [Aliivibrio sifiae]GLR74120.1 hypothetical protein GCM10007855_09940 [Aliivibrio sifiae]
MTIPKVLLRDLLGLALIISIVLATLYIFLDMFALLAYFTHEEKIASLFFSESLYLLVFFIPPYFINKYIGYLDTVRTIEDH